MVSTYPYFLPFMFQKFSKHRKFSHMIRKLKRGMNKHKINPSMWASIVASHKMYRRCVTNYKHIEEKRERKAEKGERIEDEKDNMLHDEALSCIKSGSHMVQLYPFLKERVFQTENICVFVCLSVCRTNQKAAFLKKRGKADFRLESEWPQVIKPPESES